MQAHSRPSSFWSSWLFVASMGVMVFGLALVLAPGLAREGFAWLVYTDTHHISTFDADAVAYISHVHAVLGAVMFGWGVALFFIVRVLFTRGEREGWQIIAMSILAWFIPDTAFSLWSGFWHNAVLNVVVAVLFAIPLAATYRAFHETRA